MTKFIAILNVIAWAGFWAFGYLALSADPANQNEVLIAGLLAAAGGGIGMYTFLRCARHCERTGYAKPVPRARISEDGDGDAL